MLHGSAPRHDAKEDTGPDPAAESHVWLDGSLMGMIAVAWRSMIVGTARVIRPIGGHSADLFTLWDLVEQFRQHGTVVIAAWGKLHRRDGHCNQPDPQKRTVLQGRLPGRPK